MAPTCKSVPPGSESKFIVRDDDGQVNPLKTLGEMAQNKVCATGKRSAATLIDRYFEPNQKEGAKNVYQRMLKIEQPKEPWKEIALKFSLQYLAKNDAGLRSGAEPYCAKALTCSRSEDAGIQCDDGNAIDIMRDCTSAIYGKNCGDTAEFFVNASDAQKQDKKVCGRLWGYLLQAVIGVAHHDCVYTLGKSMSVYGEQGYKIEVSCHRQEENDQ